MGVGNDSEMILVAAGDSVDLEIRLKLIVTDEVFSTMSEDELKYTVHGCGIGTGSGGSTLSIDNWNWYLEHGGE